MTEGGLFLQERAEMSKLIAIAKMLEDPETRLFAILDLICQRFPSFVDQRRPGLVGGDDDHGDDDDDIVNLDEVYPAQLIQVTDSRKQPCSVSLLGFWLLQELEEAFGGGLEVIKIEGIMIDQLEEPWLTWLNLRHQEVMTRFDTHTVKCESQRDVELISALIQQHQNVKMVWLEVRGDIGAEGWNALARAMVARPGVVRSIETDRGALGGPLGGPHIGATEEDLRAIWVQLAPRGNIVVETHCRKGFSDFFYRDGGDGEEDWRELLGFSTGDLGYCCQECTPAFDGLG